MKERRDRDQRIDEQLYRLAFEASPSPKIITDEEGRIFRVNAEAEKLFGYERGELAGKPAEILIPERLRSQYRTQFTHLETRPLGLGQDLFGLRKNGSEFPVEIGLNPVRIGKRYYVLSAIIDLTEQKRVEKHREEVLTLEKRWRAEAETANRLKDEFLAVISHELRTPLQAVLGWAGMLRSGVLSGEKQRRAAEMVERNARIQAKIVEDILDMSSIITGKLRLEFHTVDLASVIQMVVENMRLHMKAKNIQISVDLDPQASLVRGDTNRLQQVVWNLLSNAVKFTPRGGKIRIRLALTETAAAEIVVSDTGIGINPRFLPHVFDRFRQEDSSHTRTHGGLGLGLAIVSHLVELHGGQVRAESAGEGQGAAFTVTLPALTMAGEEIKRDDETPPSPESVDSLRGATVLLIDDDAATREFISEMLELFGITAVLATSAAEGLEEFHRVRPDVIVSDIEMPGEDGFSLIRKIRREEAPGERVPAIALTAHAQEYIKLQARQAGFDIHVAKPIDSQALLRIMIRLREVAR